LSAIYCTPGPDNSNLISTENAVPNSPENNANIKYNVPISFALLEKNQRSHHILMSDFTVPNGKLLHSTFSESRLLNFNWLDDSKDDKLSHKDSSLSGSRF